MKKQKNKLVYFVSWRGNEKNYYYFTYSVNSGLDLTNVKSLGYKKDDKIIINELNTEFIALDDIGKFEYSTIDINKCLEYISCNNDLTVKNPNIYLARDILMYKFNFYVCGLNPPSLGGISF